MSKKVFVVTEALVAIGAVSDDKFHEIIKTAKRKRIVKTKYFLPFDIFAVVV